MYNGSKRKPQRLKFYDYSSIGYYFITICTKNRENYFGEIVDGKMILNKYGEIAENVLLNLSKHYKNCEIDEYIFMPNHFHGIIVINDDDNGNDDDVGTGLKPVPTCNVDNNDNDNVNVRTGLKPVPACNVDNNDNGDVNVRTGFKPVPTAVTAITVVTTVKHGLSEIIRGFKTFSSRNINNYQNKFIFSWQRSFYDVIIRNEKQLNIIRQYIIDNPLKWEFDKNNT